MRLLGFFLILAGIAMLATRGFDFKTKKKVVDTDVVDISRTEKRTATWPRFAGGLVILAGVAIVLVKGRKKPVT